MSTFPGEETLVGSWHALAHVFPGASVRQRRWSVTALFPSRPTLNNAILQGPATAVAAAEAAADLTRVYEGAAVEGWALWLRSSMVTLAPSGPRHSLRGMVRRGNVAVMTRTLTPGVASHPALVSTSVPAAMSPGGCLPNVLPGPDGVPGLDGWVLLQRDVPVVAGWTFLHGTECGLYGVSTLPRRERRGVTTQFVRHVLARMQRRGARTASLQSTPAQAAFYGSLGFRARARYEQWTPRGPVSRGAARGLDQLDQWGE